MTSDALVAVLEEHRMPPQPPDLDRLARDRVSKLREQMVRSNVDILLLMHGAHVTYATGARSRGVDVTHAVFDRPVAMLLAGDERPHLFGSNDGLIGTRHEPLCPELDEGAGALRRALDDVAGGIGGKTIAVDEQTGAMLRAETLAGANVVDAGAVIGPAKLCKTADELACIAEAQRENERAMQSTAALLTPDMTRARLAAHFLGALSAAGVEANMIDPIFQTMPRSLADGPRTSTGSVAFPTAGSDVPFADGDVVWVDAGITHHGYASDFGRTWIVGGAPTERQRSSFRAWCRVMHAVLDAIAPGATGADLIVAAEAANGGERPWLPHFYLAHGVGIESAEMPFVGTDLGASFDEGLALSEGMVLVLEPVIWDDGAAGYRSEEIVAVTESGWSHLGGGHSYSPFDT